MTANRVLELFGYSTRLTKGIRWSKIVQKIDYFLTSVKGSKVRDFVAVEFQTLDSTGTVWPERQRLLREKGVSVPDEDVHIAKSFGVNWKMTAKTILLQLYHKIQTFEHFNKHLVLIVQNYFFDYMHRKFNFGHLRTARLGDPMHIHSYHLKCTGEIFQLELESRHSTDSAGIAECLGLQAESKVELEKRVSANTLLSLPISPSAQMPSK